MNEQWRWFMVGFLTSFFLLGKIPILSAEDDFQSWNAVELKKRLSPEWELFFLPEVRIRDDASELFYHEYRQGIRYKPSQHLQVGMNYLFVRNESTGKVREEHTGELDITPKAKMGPFDLSVRGRLALRTIQGSAGEDEWQVRAMPKIAYPTKLSGHPVTPYLADDLFYDFTADAWNQNRAYLGSAIPLWKGNGVEVGIDLYYMIQNLRSVRKDWNSNHILGTKFSIQF